MFQVISRNQEDIKLENEYRMKIKLLQDEFKEKQSEFDKKLGKYNLLLKKLNTATDVNKIDELNVSIKKLETELVNKPNDDIGKIIAPNTDVKMKVSKKK